MDFLFHLVLLDIVVVGLVLTTIFIGSIDRKHRLVPTLTVLAFALSMYAFPATVLTVLGEF